MSVSVVSPAQAKLAAERTSEYRAREAEKGITQVNIRVPASWSTTMHIVARELRAGMLLQEVVVRDPATGLVRTIIFGSEVSR